MVVDQKVTAGDAVDKGDSLYTVVVPRTLGNAGEAVAAVAPVRNAAYVVDAEKSTVTYRALATGVLTDVRSNEGGFVQSGAPLATITAGGVAVRGGGVPALSPATTAGSRRAPTSTCSCPTTATVAGRGQRRLGGRPTAGWP